MACSSCHFQSYPVLTGFGKSFKTNGFTMMGSQPLIEGEHHLSLPSTLNASVYMQARTNQENAGNTGSSAKVDIPDEFALFLGGRVTENAGVLVEYNLKGGFANLKFPQVVDLGDMKLSVIPFSTDGLGPAFGFDLFATGSAANGRVIENGDTGYAAAMYLGTNAAATGAAVVVASDMFHVALTPYAGARTGDIDAATGLGGVYLRAAVTPTIAGWDIGVGVQNFSGDPVKGAVAGGVNLSGTQKAAATIFDAQAQGELAGLPVGLYASMGSAAADSTGTTSNPYNGGTEVRSAFGMLAEVGVVPGTLMVDVGMMIAKTGVKDASGTNETDNSMTVGAKYKLAQNMKLGFAYTTNSGTAYDNGGSQGLRGKGRITTVFSFGF
jgi:hypothetical protein